MTGKRPAPQRPQTTGTPSASTTSASLTSEPPAYLTGHAAMIWRETIADLEAEGRPIHRLNRQCLVGFCDAAAIVRECTATLATEGNLVDGGREGQKRNPAASIRMAALTQVRAFGAELGLSPASSGRLPKPSAPARPNKFHNL